MNTQEKEPELGEGVTSAEFWVYDGKLGRRWNVDPVFIATFSSYSTFSNNPNLFVDWLGNTFDPANKMIADEVRKEAIAKKQTSSSRLNELNSNNLNLNLKLVSELKKENNQDVIKEIYNQIQANKKEIEYLNNQIQTIDRTLKNLDILESILTPVELVQQPFISGASTEHGKITYSFMDKIPTITIKYDNIETLIHEMQHAVDLVQKNGYSYALKNPIDGSYLYMVQTFIEDEIEAERLAYYWGDYNSTNRVFTLNQINAEYLKNTTSYNLKQNRFTISTLEDAWIAYNKEYYYGFQPLDRLHASKTPISDFLNKNISLGDVINETGIHYKLYMYQYK